MNRDFQDGTNWGWLDIILFLGEIVVEKIWKYTYMMREKIVLLKMIKTNNCFMYLSNPSTMGGMWHKVNF